MLYESDVIEAVCKYLVSKKYRIEQRLTKEQKGDDIIAVSSDGNKKIYIEGKGETSSKPTTSRYSTPFDRAQIRNHVAEAFYRAAQKINGSNDQSVYSGIALPKIPNHMDMIERVKLALKILQIEVFWIDPKGFVEVEGNWGDG